MQEFILIGAGFVAGLIDSIAGGGGLITLPALSLKLGLGPHSIGTNKIVGCTGALVALFIYARHTPIPWGTAIAFALVEGIGAFCGASITPHLPAEVFPVLLLITCPLVLWIVWRKDLWVAREIHVNTLPRLSVGFLGSAFACGVYDGGWGPGGGTFMFLSLYFIVKLPLVAAIATSKLVNTVSAGSSGVRFAMSGYVHVVEGCVMALGMGAGALLGAHFASRRAAQLVRPVLLVVVILLIARLVGTYKGL